MDFARKPVSDEELAALLVKLMTMAQHLVKTQKGQFFPCAAALDELGKVSTFGAELGVENPRTVDVLAFYRNFFRSRAAEGLIRGCGIAVNVGARLPGYRGKVDAICCFVERLGKDPIQVFVPFKKSLFGGYKFLNAVTLPGEAIVFADGD